MTFTVVEVSTFYTARIPNLRQRGRRWRGSCPIHGGKHDSFSVDPETGLWRCWSDCGRGGDLITLEMALTGVTWRDAVIEIERIIGRTLLSRPASRAERRAFVERRRTASAMSADIANWRDAFVLELNAQKLAAIDDNALARAAGLCNVLENGSPEDIVREFIRHQVSDPADVARLIAAGQDRDIESEQITAKVVLLLALAAAKGSRDAA